MKKHFVVVRLALGLLAALAVSPSLSRAQPDGDGLGAGATAFAKANNAFACELFRDVGKNGKNLFISPVSISSVMDLVAAGAASETATEMHRVLHLSTSVPDLASGLAAILKRAQAGEPDHAVELHSANALWVQKQFSLKDAFTTLATHSFGSAIRSIDFQHTPQSAAHEINEWVEGQTNGRIKDLLSPGLISQLTKVIVVNALYFKARWEHPFVPSATADAPFTPAHGAAGTVPMMHLQASFQYTEDADAQVLRMDYDSGAMSMTVILPKAPAGLEQIERGLTPEKIASWDQAGGYREVNVSLPHFRIEDSFFLSDALKRLGMKLAFEQNDADFSGIEATKTLFISEVVHKTFIAVDENGTEAAAATAALMKAGSAMRQPAPPVSFVANHPFLFLIRDAASGTIFFMGRYSGEG